jgi:hypothetical protein
VRGCLFTLVLALAAGAVIVVVGLPAAASAVLTAGLTAAGLQAEDTTVTVSSDPPTDLVALHADTVRVRATDATFRGMAIGELDLQLGGVAILERTAASVDGELRDVTVEVGDRPLTLARIMVLGTGDEVTTTTLVPNAAAEALIADAIADQAGVRPDSVRLQGPDELAVQAGPVTLRGRLAVVPGGDLVVRIVDGPVAGSAVVLVRGGRDLPIELTDVRVTDAGDVRLTGDLALGLLG